MITRMLIRIIHQDAVTTEASTLDKKINILKSIFGDPNTR